MSTLRTISNFKSALKGGGARPNLFEVSLSTFPAAAIAAAGVAGGGETHGPLRGDGLTCKVVTTNVDSG